jgi:hypothetical protein
MDSRQPIGATADCAGADTSTGSVKKIKKKDSFYSYCLKCWLFEMITVLERYKALNHLFAIGYCRHAGKKNPEF